MEIFLLYLLTRLDALQGLFIAMGIGGFGAALMCFIFAYVEDEKKLIPWGWRSTWIVLAGVLGAVVVPSKNDALFIAAGAGVIEAAKSDAAKRIASKSVAVIEKFLDDQIKKKAKD